MRSKKLVFTQLFLNVENREFGFGEKRENQTGVDIRQYLLYCQEKGDKANTVNAKLLRIRAFLNYMVECEVIRNNPAKKVKLQKDDVKIDVFTDEQIRQMLNFYRRIRQRDKTNVAYRDYMVIVLILGTGIRRGEIINLQWTDVGKNRERVCNSRFGVVK